MIGRVLPRGQKVAGLVRYLYGPGRAEEHHNPHIVASWSGETASLDPEVTARGQRDFRDLVALLEAPITAEPEWSRTERPVYHVAVRAAAEDRVLSDQEWSELAAEMMHNVGLSRRDAPEAGVRWIAVRHADDHIHIVATLARQDGTTPRRSNDFHRVRETCRVFEIRYGLRGTAPADGTAARRPHRAEIEKAHRTGRHETARDRLRREVRAAAAAAAGEADFFGRLKAAGVMVKLRESKVNAGEITGFAVSLPGVRAADGAAVWYGGGRLAADLTLPKLRQRWSPDLAAEPGMTRPGAQAAASGDRARMSAEERRQAVSEVAREAAAAAEDLRRTVREDPGAASAAATAYAAADAVTAAARVIEGSRGGPLTAAADRFDHAAREQYGQVPRPAGRSEHLRAATRLLSAARRINPEDPALQAAELLSRLAALADTVALMRRLQRRSAQAAAARIAATEMRAAAARYGGAAGPGRAQAPSVSPAPSPSPADRRRSRRPGGPAAPGR